MSDHNESNHALPESPLPPLPTAINFVVRWSDKWRDLIDSPDVMPESLHGEHWRVVSNEEMFVVQTYVNLKRRGLDVRLVDAFVPGTMNVVSGLDFGIKEQTHDSFVIALRGDGFRPALADAILAHNTSVMQPQDFWMPAWLQTGLLPRDRSRGTRLEVLEFKGDEINLHEWFKTPEFAARLDQLDMSFRIGGYDLTESNRWHDYETTDLILAARDLPVADADVKPALKLVNAWGAGTPALLGPESGYRQMRRSPLDYIEVRTPEQVLNAISLLKDQPRLYEAMVDNGLARAEHYSDDATALRWHSLLDGPLHERYQHWLAEPSRTRMIRFAKRSVDHKAQMRAAAYRRTHGPRLLTGSPSEPIVDFDDPTYGLA